jgi:DNA-binding response OmpR family regulator
MPETILIVDDETDLADTCARLLKREGYECLVAYGMEDAIALFDARHPKLVLSDITLPTGDGFEIARHVRQHAPGTPVILMTAYHSGNSADEARLAGAAGYLRKPFANAELVATVKSFTDGGS